MFETDYKTALEWISAGNYAAVMEHDMFPGREHDPRERWLQKRWNVLIWVYPDGQYLEAMPKEFWAERKWIVRRIK